MKSIINQPELRQYPPLGSDQKIPTDPMHGFIIKSQVLELLGLQLQQINNESYYESDFRYDEIRKLHQLKKYIESHYLQELSLTQLSRICLLNEYKVKKGFKTLFNTTVFGYIRKLKMEHACHLLRHSANSIIEIAEILNYEYPHHFSAAFKKNIGISPSHYKSKMRFDNI